jgi:hypothetical protein
MVGVSVMVGVGVLVGVCVVVGVTLAVGVGVEVGDNVGVRVAEGADVVISGEGVAACVMEQPASVAASNTSRSKAGRSREWAGARLIL